MQKFTTYMAVTTSLKGGGGKSMFACAMLDNLRHGGVFVAAYDADGAVGSLIDMHGSRDKDGKLLEQQNPTEGVYAYNIRDGSRTMMFESLGSGAPLVLHDVAGGALGELERVLSDADDGLQDFFQGIQEQDACVVFMHLITPDRSTVESVAMHLDITDRLGDTAAGDLSNHARHIAVLNRYGNRKNEDFPDWFGYEDANGVTRGGKTRKRLLESGGAEMELPAVSDRTMALLKALQIPFKQAVQDPRLDLTNRQIISNFRKKFDAAMSVQVRALLGLPV
jgi:hypothetical protein